MVIGLHRIKDFIYWFSNSKLFDIQEYIINTTGNFNAECCF